MLRSPEFLMVLEREKKMFSRACGAEKHLCSGPRLTASEAKTGRQPPGELNASLHHQSSLGDPTERVQWEASGLTPHRDLGQGEGCARPGKWVRIWSTTTALPPTLCLFPSTPNLPQPLALNPKEEVTANFLLHGDHQPSRGLRKEH